jgi:hypothetical protein
VHFDTAAAAKEETNLKSRTEAVKKWLPSSVQDLVVAVLPSSCKPDGFPFRFFSPQVFYFLD